MTTETLEKANSLSKDLDVAKKHLERVKEYIHRYANQKQGSTSDEEFKRVCLPKLSLQHPTLNDSLRLFADFLIVEPQAILDVYVIKLEKHIKELETEIEAL